MFELVNTYCALSIYLLWGRVLITINKGVAARLFERISFQFDWRGVD
jgi:hypothetical protein